MHALLRSDAWPELHTGDPGLTYDVKANPMLNPRSRLRRRLDRLFFKLRDYRPAAAELVGTRPIPGVTHTETDSRGREAPRPVLPSDHFGLLVTLQRVE